MEFSQGIPQVRSQRLAALLEFGDEQNLEFLANLTICQVCARFRAPNANGGTMPVAPFAFPIGFVSPSNRFARSGRNPARFKCGVLLRNRPIGSEVPSGFQTGSSPVPRMGQDPRPDERQDEARGAAAVRC